ARNARDVLELVVIRLELVVADRPVLDVIAFGQNALAVALDHVATDAEIVGQKAPGLPVPVQAAPPTPLPGRKLPHWRIGSAVCDGLLRMVSVSCFGRRNMSWRIA